MILPRIPSPALAACILAEAVDGPIEVTLRVESVGYPPAPGKRGPVELLHADGSELSESEQRRVRGWLAADDAEPFGAVS